ncbi:MAG: thioredoxin domain-containing protein [Candidatus Marinimicrobia bacterium]|nr:thioredoxin domain-containing protein [Candidatus Neomarinimicrobiota bacterium]
MVEEVLEKYPNDVRVVIKNFPLSSHKQANKAALYALAAERQGKYYEMYKRIFADYRSLRTNEDLPLQYAQELGLDIDQLHADMKDPALQDRITRETKQLRSSGMRTAVPKFLINGKEPKGRSIGAWSSIIDEALKK